MMNRLRFRLLMLGNVLILILTFSTALFFPGVRATAQQVHIVAIDTMPNFPQPYHMRDWRKVTIGYDSLVFNSSLSGEYLPLVTNPGISNNYPSDPTFGLYTVVGPTQGTGTAEAINCIPAVVGASLVGINKTDQFNRNWVQMCEQWFNKANGENVYMNGLSDMTNDDFWYETMPNVFFYELNYLHPNTSNFSSQFVSVANQFSKVVTALGGSTTPWKLPGINHEGFDFEKMVPVDVSSDGNSWTEPEAAGAIGWILYNAYVETGNPQYRIGAELSMEALNNSPINPAYELQLSYGAYTAARMNAELGTNYNVQKIVNWLFSTSDVRDWATITGKWGVYDVGGLVGQVEPNDDYAFAMNTFEQIGCLVPMVRYDPVFATAIGKWVLNAANAARLFYPKSLPHDNQDTSYIWAIKYDSSSYIAHEAIHQFDPNDNSISPFASGDAITGGWGRTTLTLYGSSHVGILGAIIDTTDVPGILQLNLLATDYYHAPAYPTYLYYNPDSTSQTIALNVGDTACSIYDAVSKTFITSGTGLLSISIPASSAIVAVVTPYGGTVTRNQHGALLVNGVVVDYHYNTPSSLPPRIKSLAAGNSTVVLGDTTRIYCTAADNDNDSLTYSWSFAHGTSAGTGAVLSWAAPDTAGTYVVACTVSDGHGFTDTASVVINVVQKINSLPVITGIDGEPRVVDVGGALQLTCHASDPDGDTIRYNWTPSAGTVTGSDSIVTWTAPQSEGYYYVYCKVNDGSGGTATDSIGILVQDFSKSQTGSLAAFYPFDDGSVADASGNNNNGFNYYASQDTDRFGNPTGALFFNGTNNYVNVSNSPSLDFQNAITVSFWMKIAQIFSGEEYPISHNKWYRWKVSISGGHLRWSTTTSQGERDLDSETPMVADSLYFVTVVYSGSAMEIYLNGNLDAYAPWSGPLATTNADLVIGAAAAAQNQQEFYGTLDDIRIYNYALSFPAIQGLLTVVHQNGVGAIPKTFALRQNFPNPFNPSTIIQYDLPEKAEVVLQVYDVLGRKVRTLVDNMEQAGTHEVSFDASDLASGVYFCRLKAGDHSAVKAMMLLK